MVNDFEQMEEKYLEQEKEAREELNRIDIASEKMFEKYGDNETIWSFVIYLTSMEKVFARAKIYDSSQLSIKDDLIKAEMKIFSEDIAIEEDVLDQIKDDFSSVYQTVSSIHKVSEKLFEKYADNAGCGKFIETLRETTLIFVEAHDNNFNIDEIRDRVYQSKMKILSASGNPDLALLKKVYSEFRNELDV